MVLTFNPENDYADKYWANDNILNELDKLFQSRGVGVIKSMYYPSCPSSNIKSEGIRGCTISWCNSWQDRLQVVQYPHVEELEQDVSDFIAACQEIVNRAKRRPD